MVIPMAASNNNMILLFSNEDEITLLSLFIVVFLSGILLFLLAPGVWATFVLEYNESFVLLLSSIMSRILRETRLLFIFKKAGKKWFVYIR